MNRLGHRTTSDFISEVSLLMLTNSVIGFHSLISNQLNLQGVIIVTLILILKYVRTSCLGLRVLKNGF